MIRTANYSDAHPIATLVNKIKDWANSFWLRRRHLQPHTMAPPASKMSILSSRPELLAYYERRGYQLTGACAPYSADAGVGQPRGVALQVPSLLKQPDADRGGLER